MWLESIDIGYIFEPKMMEVTFKNTDLSREEKYDQIIFQISALMDQKVDWVANSANLCAALKEVFGWLWIGIYRKVSEEYLQLGPFQGPVACTFIHKGKGVCGSVWEQGETIIVPNVEEFPGHISCSSLSKSEIVLPIYVENEFWGVLDIDSEELDQFSDMDKTNLLKIIKEFEKYL